MADVMLNPAGRTSDGKPLFAVQQIVPDPELIVGGEKGNKQNTLNTIKDEFGIVRPKRNWACELCESIADRLRS
ncbi:MAG: hypothetical protein WCV90_09160 [Candidatus Woesearchaeota archaeon]|jgi:hypothetical protein